MHRIRDRAARSIIGAVQTTLAYRERVEVAILGILLS